jgi:hypothetical protein
MSGVPIFFEGSVQLAGWSESHSQGCRVTFWIESPEALEPFRLATVRKGRVAGQIFQMVLVEVDPDEGEKPMQHPSNAAHLKITSEKFLEYAKWVLPNVRKNWDTSRARAWAKWLMDVKSLSELDSNPHALERYHRLVRIPFDKWLHQQYPDMSNDYDGAEE